MACLSIKTIENLTRLVKLVHVLAGTAFSHDELNWHHQNRILITHICYVFFC